MATIAEILASGYKLIFTRPGTNRLAPEIEATLPTALKVGEAGGVAKLSPEGVPIDTAGRRMASLGTTAGTAADAKATTDALSAISGAVDDVAGALAGKLSPGDTLRSTFMAATPTNANLIAAGETASPSDPLIVYTLGQ